MENETMHREESNPFLKLHAEIEVIKTRQKQLKILIQAEKLQKEGGRLEENIDEKLHNLANEYCRKTDAATVQDVIIPALQLSDTLYKAVIAKSGENSTQMEQELFDSTDADFKKQLCALLEQIAGMSSEIVESRKEIKALEDSILKTQQEIHQTSSEKLQLIKKLQERKKVRQEKKVVECQSSNTPVLEEDIISKLTIMNHILQKVIAFSGINWAEDDELKAIVLGAGKSLRSQLLEHETQSNLKM